MKNTIQEISKMAGTHMDRSINLSEAEKYFEGIFTKVLNNVSISHDEEEYLNKFMRYLYPKVGGELYPYPRYDEKLKDIYQKASDYYLSHLNKNTEGSIVFLWYFQMNQMSKENNMQPRLAIGHEKFEKEPQCAAFHTEEVTAIGRFPAVFFNPKIITRCMEDKKNILLLLETSIHELRHAMQHQMVYSSNLNDPQALIWAKEYITRSVIGDSYYNLNYTNIFHERDARYYSRVRMNKVLAGKGYKFPNVEVDSYNLDVRHKENENSEELLAIDLLDAVSSKTLQSHPDILKYYQVLQNIYNMDGTKKTVPQIELELNTRFEKESANGLSGEEINKKAHELLNGICATDNDLRFQYLCQEAANLYDETKTDEFNQVISEIKGLLEQRELSYDEFEMNMKSRIQRLIKQRNLILQPKDGERFNQEEYRKISSELSSTKRLLDAAIEYNPKFKEEHNERVMKSKIKQRLSAKIHQTIGDRYNYYATDKGYLEAVHMTPEEENERYRREIEALLDANTRDGILDGSQFETDVHDLSTYYQLDGVRK